MRPLETCKSPESAYVDLARCTGGEGRIGSLNMLDGVHTLTGNVLRGGSHGGTVQANPKIMGRVD